MDNGENSRARRLEDVEIVKELLAEDPNIKYFTCKRLARLTNGLSTKRIAYGVKWIYHNEMGLIERYSKNTWIVL